MKARIYYLKNSGFAVMLAHSLLVFDCYSFRPENGGFEDGVIDASALSDFERVYFFVSHKHADHFNQRIYDLDVNPNTHYIVATGTSKSSAPEKRTALRESDVYNDEYLSVYAGGSTDTGVSFVIDAEGKRFFHAGDLNCWHWAQEWSEEEEMRERRLFTKALDRLYPHAKNIDLAFFPVDPRMKGPYDDGAKEFAARFKPRFFVPMHCQNEYDVIDKFKAEAETPDMTVLAYHARGELIEVDL